MTFIVHQRIAPYTVRPQAKTLDSFLLSSTRDGRVHTKAFWELREFYSVGTSTFPNTALSFGNTQHVHAISYCGIFPIVYFHSVHLQSTDYLFCNPQLRDNIPLRVLLGQTLRPLIQENEVLYENDLLLLTNPLPNIVTLFFVASPEEVRQTIGFFDFNLLESEFLKQSLWINRSDFVYKGDITALRNRLAQYNKP